MLVFIIVAVIFYVLVRIFISEPKNKMPVKFEPFEVTLIIPPEHPLDDDPISLLDRNKLRGQLFRSVFLLGLQTRNQLENLQKEDMKIFWRPYYYHSHNHEKIICNQIKKLKS